MKIEKIEVIRFQLPLTHTFETSFGKVTHKDSILVKMYSGGLVGYGEGSTLPAPLYVPEYSNATFNAMLDFIGPAVIGKNFKNPQALVEGYSHIKGWNFAKTAIETAFWDIYSQKEKKSVQKILKGTKKFIPVGESLGIKNTIEELLAEVELRISEGYKRIKVKTKPGWDLKPLKAIRQKFGNIDLMVDGNSAYTLKHLKTLKELDNFNLTMIEQPLAYDDIIDHATLQRAIKTPICLDESILSAEDAQKAITIGACKIINIKPGRVGGLIESKKIHDVCKKNKVGVWCGGMLETCIGRFFNLSVASLPNYQYPADMSPSSIFFKEDLVDHPFQVKNGLVEVPEKLSDFKVNDKLIKKYTLKKETLKP